MHIGHMINTYIITIPYSVDAPSSFSRVKAEETAGYAYRKSYCRADSFETSVSVSFTYDSFSSKTNSSYQVLHGSTCASERMIMLTLYCRERGA